MRVFNKFISVFDAFICVLIQLCTFVFVIFLTVFHQILAWAWAWAQAGPGPSRPQRPNRPGPSGPPKQVRPKQARAQTGLGPSEGAGPYELIKTQGISLIHRGGYEWLTPWRSPKMEHPELCMNLHIQTISHAYHMDDKNHEVCILHYMFSDVFNTYVIYVSCVRPGTGSQATRYKT